MTTTSNLSIDEITKRYQRYVDEYPTDSGFGMGGPTGLPLKDSVVSGSGANNFKLNVSNIDFECLLVPEFDSESHRPIENRDAIRGLDNDVLFRLSAQLMNIQKVQITKDHKVFWNYTAEIAKRIEFGEYPVSNEDIEYFETVVALVSLPPNPITDEKLQTIMSHSDSIASYIAYPVLEGVAKRYCHEYLNMDGTIKPGKAISMYNDGEKDSGEITQVGHLLHHIETVAGSPEVQQEMKKMREQVADFYDWPEDVVYGPITDLRNTWLHGEDQAKAEYGTLISYTALLLWAMMLEK